MKLFGSQSQTLKSDVSLSNYVVEVVRGEMQGEEGGRQEKCVWAEHTREN